jgi:hypothetical protein
MGLCDNYGSNQLFYAVLHNYHSDPFSTPLNCVYYCTAYYGALLYRVLPNSNTISMSMPRPGIKRDDIHRALIDSLRPALTVGAGSGKPRSLRDVRHFCG